MTDAGVMAIFSRGLTVTTKASPLSSSSVDSRGGWWPIIREPFSGAWQRGEELRVDVGLSHPTLFRCVSLISSDIAKMCLNLVEETEDDIWVEATSAAFSPVLTKPNRYQNRIQFVAQWVISKLLHGNTYVLKVRDNRSVVTGLYILDPLKVRPLVALDGSVYYQLGRDNLSGVEDETTAVPASEIIHDRWNTIFHPLVGISPIYACGLAALQGQEIQRNSARFFKNGSNPGGVLTAPGTISDDIAKRLKDHWDQNYTGENVGKVAVLGDGLKYEAMAVNAADAQLIEQLKWTSETICSVLGVPAYMVGVGPAPLNNNVEALAQQYYSQCLQIHIESIELCLDEGLALPANYSVCFDLDDLLRMDTATQVKTLVEAVGGKLMKPDEARAKLNLGKVKGGDTVYAQQQDFSLSALADRDANKPFAKPTGAPASNPAPDATPADVPANDMAAAFEFLLTKAVDQLARAA